MFVQRTPFLSFICVDFTLTQTHTKYLFDHFQLLPDSNANILAVTSLTIQPCVFYCDIHNISVAYTKYTYIYNVTAKANTNRLTPMYEICKAQQSGVMCMVPTASICTVHTHTAFRNKHLREN